MNILIVDDDEIARMSLVNILRGLGRMAEAADGEEAWRLLQDGLRPAVCCCDIMMPRLDGLGLLQRTRAHPVLKALPFVLISSAADRQTVQNAINRGAAGYILKPFLGVQTRATVERVLRERRVAQAEHFLATRRRLGLQPGELEKALHELRGDSDDCARLLQQPEASRAAQVGSLQRLHSVSLHLGLWRCAAVLDETLQPRTAMEQRVLLVQEVARLVDEQLLELSELTPPVQPA
ncbi:MAG TPA: response regulator [Ramlibacter sp.]|jgi:two-component system chemotaxis response regulator CheY|uniref:response regulator transcription factor n=1 Tax=Ramlibacter sp. TaxID=1917967 RepID=UPI002D62C2BC|nr:response regulator [Ramlibacter sp.]HZY18561.1 response regulator [Ramlibacter sp.]